MRFNDKGFTLIEMLVVIALLSIIMIGLLNLLDTSSKISVVETSLADTQENVRFAAYHIMRTARMMGSAALPFAANVGGSDQWMAGELVSNVTGGTATTPFGSVDVVEGSDVLTVRGLFEIAPFFTDRTDLGSGVITIRESDAGEVINDNFNLVDVNGLEGRGLFFVGRMDQGEYAVGQIAAGSAFTGTAPDRTLAINFGAGTAQWSGLNRSGTSVTPVTFDVYRVGVFESYTYYVAPDRTLQRMRADATGASSEPVAVNIGSLQVALGVDNNNDSQVDAWMAAPTAAQIAGNRVIGMRITVLGRTSREVPDWVEPEVTFQVEDMDASLVNRNAKWRRIEVAAALRNYLF
jgi:prepilin-type N-terminal cleavage/methylation domain-containing protein